MGIRNASTLKVSCKLTTNSDTNGKCKSHPAGILSFPAIHSHNHPPNQKATSVFALHLAKEADTAALGAGWRGWGWGWGWGWGGGISNLNPQILPFSKGKNFVEVIN